MFRHQVLHSLVVFWSCCVRFYCFVVGLFLLFVVVHLFVCVCVGVVVVFVGVAFLSHAQAGCRSHRVYASVTINFKPHAVSATSMAQAGCRSHRVYASVTI